MVNAKMVVGITVAALVILVLLAVAPMIGSTVDDVSNIQDNIQATGTFTSSTNLSKAEMDANTTSVNISTETYIFTNGTTGQWYVDVSGGGNNSSSLIAALVAEISANSTLVTAVDNGDNSTTVSSVLTGTAGNAYATTDNATGQAWGATTLTDGVDGSDWNSNVNSDLDSPAQSWITFVGMIVLAFLAVIIGLVIRIFTGYQD